MKPLALAMLLAAAPFASAAPVPKEVKGAAKLDGLWEIVSIEAFGSINPLSNTRWKIEGDRISVHRETPNAAARIGSSVPIRVDPTASPKALDYNVNGRTARAGIYELDGDSLKILLPAGEGSARPTEMKSGESTLLYVFKRVKE